MYANEKEKDADGLMLSLPFEQQPQDCYAGQAEAEPTWDYLMSHGEDDTAGQRTEKDQAEGEIARTGGGSGGKTIATVATMTPFAVSAGGDTCQSDFNLSRL